MMIVLENARLRIGLDEENGAVRQIRDLARGIDYVSADAGGRDPFRLETDDGFRFAYDRFSWERLPSAEGLDEVMLRWLLADGIGVEARVALAADGDEAAFRCRVDNGSAQRLHSLEYPIFSGLQAITQDGEDDYVAHPFATGFRIRNPLQAWTDASPGLRFMPYPECFSGAPMQFFAYYGMNKGGLYWAAPDAEGHPKWLNIFKNERGLLEASIIHGCNDIGAGRGIDPGYPVQLALLAGQDWHEAADRYKRWAVRQPWCAGGTAAERLRGDDERWLREAVGVATFGINAGADRTAWLRQFHEQIRTPMFHVLGPDWTRAPQTFGQGVPGGFDDWFPTRFNPENLAVMKEYGDRFAPFEFDYLYHFEGADGELGRAAAQQFPANKKSIDAYAFPLLCPAHPYTEAFHVRRDEELQRSVGVDAVYYDISANNILKICMDDAHGHPVGAGRLIEEAYRRNYAETKAAMARAAGRYVPMGTEMMNETMLGLIDFYQARAGAQPAAPLEGYPLRHLLKTGEAELIPMFDYVYHEYGAVRMDGWGKLVSEIGELFFFTVARTYLWGGLYELNYEYSPMEALDGRENAPEEHYYPFEPRGYAYAPDRAAYVNLFAELRVGTANKYWSYGQMLRPMAFATDRIRMPWFHYNHGVKSPEYNDSGELEADAVIHSAWRGPGAEIGLFFANVSAAPREVEVATRPYLNGARTIGGTIHSLDGEAELPYRKSGDGGKLSFTIPARSVVMLQAT